MILGVKQIWKAEKLKKTQITIQNVRLRQKATARQGRKKGSACAPHRPDWANVWAQLRREPHWRPGGLAIARNEGVNDSQ
jgi:hypothetical protein